MFTTATTILIPIFAVVCICRWDYMESMMPGALEGDTWV